MSKMFIRSSSLFNLVCFFILLCADARKTSNPLIHKKKEFEMTYGQRVSLECMVANENSTISWKAVKNDLEKANSRFSYFGTPSNKVLTISELSYSDRDVYTCTSIYQNVTSIMKFTVRVRDPMGALWPIIGIAVGVFVLFLIIWLHAFNKTKIYGTPKEEVKTSKGDEAELTMMQFLSDE